MEKSYNEPQSQLDHQQMTNEMDIGQPPASWPSIVCLFFLPNEKKSTWFYPFNNTAHAEKFQLKSKEKNMEFWMRENSIVCVSEQSIWTLKNFVSRVFLCSSIPHFSSD